MIDNEATVNRDFQNGGRGFGMLRDQRVRVPTIYLGGSK